MATKKPQTPDFSDFMKIFDPEQITKFFDPEQFKSVFESFQTPALDLQAMMDANKANFEAMVAANKSATSAYQDFYQKQMAIFEEMMKGANEHFKSLAAGSGADAARKQAEVYRAAVEKAFSLMTEFAQEVQKNNQQVAQSFQARVADAVKDLGKS